jgi:hypothetical protein
MIAPAISAQQPNPSNDQQMQNMQGMQMKNGQMQQDKSMSKNSMMKDCHKHMDAMMNANAKATKDIEAAKQSNDPAKMRAALDEAEKALSPMNEHMQGCMGMMKMMQNMHGKSGMKKSSHMESKDQNTPPQN